MIRGDAHHHGPELLLRVVHASTGSLKGLEAANGQRGGSQSLRAKSKIWAERSQSPARPQPVGCTIPISDIVVAYVQDASLLFLTTREHGYFELSFRTENARDMLVAFLKKSLSPERILVEKEQKWDEPHRSFDVEALTANRIEERMRTEGIGERLRRKVAHVALQIGESAYSDDVLMSDYRLRVVLFANSLLPSREKVSSQISECACGGCGGSQTFSPQKPSSWQDDSKRQSPSPPQYRDMEFATHSIDEYNVAYSPLKKPENNASYLNLEPELEVARP